jgi:hypothetical protein
MFFLILLELPNEERHDLDSWEMNMKFYLDNLKGKDHLGKLGIDGEQY